MWFDFKSGLKNFSCLFFSFSFFATVISFCFDSYAKNIVSRISGEGQTHLDK